MGGERYTVTVREISCFSGIKMNTLNTRIHALKIKTKRIPGKGTQVFVMKKDIPTILQAKKEKFNYHKRKLEIVSMHIDGLSNNQIGDIMSICKKHISKVIKEYKEGFVVVESKINYII